MSFPQPSGREPETERKYRNRAIRLLRHHFTNVCVDGVTYTDWIQDPVMACIFIANLRTMWSRSTWRQYKASLRFFMEENCHVGAVTVLDRYDSRVCIKKPNRGPARKLKRLPSNYYVKIRDYLLKANGKYDMLINLWLLCGILTGLRPSEWEHATFDSDLNDKLTVCNAKNSNGRSTGEERILDLSDLSPVKLNGIIKFMDVLHGHVELTGNFARVYVRCRNRLSWVTSKIWPNSKRPSLYSSRHQASADLKKSGATSLEIAEIFGHASCRTAQTHYGRKKWGESRGGRVRSLANIDNDPETMDDCGQSPR